MHNSDDSEHWSIVHELERKAVVACERIAGELASGAITRSEARSAYEMVLWMFSGLIDDGELTEAITAELRSLKRSPKLGLFTKGEERVVGLGVGDKFNIIKLPKSFNFQTPSDALTGGFGYARERLLKLGYEEQ